MQFIMPTQQAVSVGFKLATFPGTVKLAGLAQLYPADSSQFLARCFRQSSIGISAALAKATVLLLTGVPSLPAPTYLRLPPSSRLC